MRLSTGTKALQGQRQRRQVRWTYWWVRLREKGMWAEKRRREERVGQDVGARWGICPIVLPGHRCVTHSLT